MRARHIGSALADRIERRLEIISISAFSVSLVGGGCNLKNRLVAVGRAN